MSRQDDDGRGAPEPPRTGRDDAEPPVAPPIRIAPRMIALLAAGLVAALLIFWFEPSFTLRYIVVGVLGGIYVLLRFNDWR